MTTRIYTQDESDKMRQKPEDIQSLLAKSNVALPSLNNLLVELKVSDTKVQDNPSHARITTSEFAAIHAVNKLLKGLK